MTGLLEGEQSDESGIHAQRERIAELRGLCGGFLVTFDTGGEIFPFYASSSSAAKKLSTTPTRDFGARTRRTFGC